MHIGRRGKKVLLKKEKRRIHIWQLFRRRFFLRVGRSIGSCCREKRKDVKSIVACCKKERRGKITQILSFDPLQKRKEEKSEKKVKKNVVGEKKYRFEKFGNNNGCFLKGVKRAKNSWNVVFAHLYTRVINILLLGKKFRFIQRKKLSFSFGFILTRPHSFNAQKDVIDCSWMMRKKSREARRRRKRERRRKKKRRRKRGRKIRSDKNHSSHTFLTQIWERNEICSSSYSHFHNRRGIFATYAPTVFSDKEKF